MDTQTAAPSRGRLGIGRGTALYLGAILGPGVLVLPQLASAAAGPASLLAWIGLLLLSIPVAITLASLAARHPDAGGVATFTRLAFGPDAAAIVGWWFYAVIPIGAVAASFIGTEYLAGIVEMDRTASLACAAAFIAIAFATNHAGLRLSGGAQLILMGLLLALLAAAIATALPHLQWANFTPFAPHGAAGVLSAAAVLFFAFAGWEAATHLAGEFTDPARQLHRVTALALIIVTAVYLGLATATTGVLGPAAARSPVPLTDLLAYGFGSAAAPITAIVATVLTLGAMNTFMAGASRLGAALARDGAMPRPLAKGGSPGAVPHRSLAVLATLSATSFAATLYWDLDLDQTMRATSACLAAVTVLACASAIKLLHGNAAKTTAIIATAFTGIVLIGLGPYLLVPAIVGAIALAYLRTRGPGRREPAPATLQGGTTDTPPAIQGAP
ncbi:APC family permease [Glycomyces buryatensis]|uniref:Amino acid permease n=1 Tax=Glycomyces buryatensis TaxID=2570927 RepID=A0A4S8PYX1_9ACTN|nr:amino acid permease [Glycomyces buryatensis]THV33439.1 amino acid permease [Glycomyces buryatensis]